MLPRSADTDTRWEAFHRYAGLDHDNYVVGSFGGSPEMATELAGLVIAGIKCHGQLGTITLGSRADTEARRFRHHAR
jgi:hypothetical protein